MSDLVKRLQDQAIALSDGPMMDAVRDRVEWEAAARIAELEAALQTANGALRLIVNWGPFPATGDEWPSGEPVSYGTKWGSNGERDYMRRQAKAALDKITALAGGGKAEAQHAAERRVIEAAGHVPWKSIVKEMRSEHDKGDGHFSTAEVESMEGFVAALAALDGGRS